jgi:hypothetical protein
METKERTFPITGKEGAEIDLNVAVDWTKNHRHRHPGGILSQFFGIEILQRLLNQPDCLGIRIYYANSKPLNGWQRFFVSVGNFFIKVVADAEGEKHFILSGVTKEGKDQLPEPLKGNNVAGNVAAHALVAAAPAGMAQQSILVEQAHPCPGSSGCPDNVLTGSL